MFKLEIFQMTALNLSCFDKEVAVVIPTYNEELYIEGCLESLRCQSYPFRQMDVMVVDGRSEDSTREIVNKLSKQWPNVRLLDNPGKIQSIAFNIGVRNSTAPYVIRLDAHVTYEEHYVEKCLDNLRTIPNVGDVGGICLTKTKGNGLVSEANAILCQSRFGIGGASFRVGAKAGYIDTVPFGAFPRTVIDEVGGMREDMARAEDNEYVTRIRKAGYNIYLDPEIVSTYYARDSFKGIIKQMYGNGLSIGQLFYVDRSAIGLRHFVPFAFLLSLIVAAIGAIFWMPFVWLFLFIVVMYFLCALAATSILCHKYGWKFFFVLPVLFFNVHCAYGWGTLVGLFKYAKQYAK